MLLEVSVDRVERRREHAPILPLGKHVEINRLKKCRVPFHRPVNDILFADLAPPDDFGVRDAVRGPQRFLGRQFKVALDVQPLARMTMRMDRPRREREQLALLVLDRDGVGLLEPALDRGILAVDDLTMSEEIAGKGGPRRPFDHFLEAGARNHLGVNVDAIFDQDAEYAFVLAIARQSPADAVRLDDPQSERFALPDRFGRQASHQHDGKDVTILRDPLDELTQRRFESSDFCNVIAFSHALLLGFELYRWR